MSAEKIASLTKYANDIENRLNSKSPKKRDNTAFLLLDLKKTKAKIEKLKMGTVGAVTEKK